MLNHINMNPITKPWANLSSKVVFKNKKPDERRTKYQEYLEKRAYIDKKTEPYNNLAIGLLLVSLFLDVHHINSLKGKLSTPKKIGIGALGLSCVAAVTGMIKEIKLSKQYDKENN